MTFDWESIGTALAGLATGAGGIGLWWFRSRVTTAEAGAQVSVIEMMRQEVARLGSRVEALENEQRADRARQHRLIRHIFRLESLMRGAGIEPPHFDIDGEEIKAGGTD